MVDITVVVDYDNSFTNLEDIMENAPEELKRRIVEILDRGAQNIVRDSQSKAPVKTGALKAHIFHVTLPNGAKVVCGVHYASFQELGTKYIEPKYFVWSSFEWHIPEITNQITECIINYFEGKRK